MFFAQNASTQNSQEYFTVRGSVKEKYTNEPVPKVTIIVNGGLYEQTSYDGNFKIKVKLGDQIRITHKDFEAVDYTITSRDRITILIVSQTQGKPTKKELRYKDVKTFNQLIDSADTYLKSDAERSIQFIADALNKSASQTQNAEAYLILGDLYVFWKQYDLAISNYKIALQNKSLSSTKLKLAKAYFINKENQQSIKTFKSINTNTLSNYQKTEYYESYGDALIKNKDVKNAIKTYNSGLEVAVKNNIKPKITDLNSKIAQAYNIGGNNQKAKEYFNSSLKLAKKQNRKRSIEEKVAVAEFNRDKKDFEKEIQLRKEAVIDIKEIEKDSLRISNDSPITPQKQNYKIANALAEQQNFDEAITYYDESIIEADKREDLEVKKDAQRRKVDAYKNLGEFEKARLAFEDFMVTVDSLYIRKQQEITQSARLSRSVTESQSRITSLESERKLSKSRYELKISENRNQQIIIYSLIGGLALFLIGAYFTYKYIKEQRLANNLLALKSLRSQMNPHFIFNALNSVNSFIALNDERTANKYLSDFSFLMRAVLENSEEDFIPLQKEIELLELYTKLEHFRFKDKFDYTIEVDEAIEVEDYEIPPMLLQPYIENAVWHGLRYKTEKGILKIKIKRKSDTEIEIAIIDNGIGREKSKSLKTENQKKHNSKGLSNIKKRISILNAMYKDKVDVTISNYNSEGDIGTKVLVTLKKD